MVRENPKDYMGQVLRVGDRVIRAAITGSQGAKNGTLETCEVTAITETGKVRLDGFSSAVQFSERLLKIA